MDTLGRDRLRELIDLILRSLDEDVDGPGMAAKAHLSRYHFDHLVSAALGESPGSFRRRLVLERAAWQLRASGASITKVTLGSGYLSVEGFTRAFARTFGMPPDRYRKTAQPPRANAPNGVHFHPPGGILVPGPHDRSKRMDFVDRLVGHDIWFTQRLIDRAAEIGDDALDRRVLEGWNLGEDEEPTTLRSLLNEMVANKEMWNAALAGEPRPENHGDRIEQLKRRYATAGPEFMKLVKRIRDRNEWDTGFVDAMCDPPESFTYGGMLAHVATFSAYRRTAAVVALRKLGVTDVGIGDPLQWERAIPSTDRQTLTS